MLSHKKWAADFRTYANATSRPKMLNFVKFHLAILHVIGMSSEFCNEREVNWKNRGKGCLMSHKRAF